MKHKYAFTLAEVLITLAIIGVIAAMTIPSLQAETDKKEYVTALKKVHSTLSNATQLLMEKGGCIGDLSCVSDFDGKNDSAFVTAYAPFMNFVEVCDKKAGCFPDLIYKFYNNTTHPSFNYHNETFTGKARTADGMSFRYADQANNCDCAELDLDGDNAGNDCVCGRLNVDINGNKGPNKFGRDMFEFWILKNGIVHPRGTSVDKATAHYKCSGFGYGCAGKVIEEGAMNY